MITLVCARQGSGAPRVVSAADLLQGAFDASAHDLVWVDVLQPSDDDIAALERTFGFHRLSLEDVARRNQRPKIDEYGTYYFAVLYAASTDLDTRRLVTDEVHLFWGASFLVTVHPRPLPAIDELATRLRNGALSPIIGASERDLHTVDLVYRLIDSIVDDYFVAIDALSEWGEALEERMFAGRAAPETLKELLTQKKTLFAARKLIAPSRDIVNHILRRNLPLFPDAYTPYFQDVYDHTVRVIDALDTYRDMLAVTLDVNLTLVSNEVSQTVKTMTAVTAILMADALVAGIYGMNFDSMPELHWPYGYAWALGLMLVVSLALLGLFKRIRWF